MFGVLLESRARRTRGRGGMAASVAIHAAVLALAAAGTGRATSSEPSVVERVDTIPLYQTDPLTPARQEARGALAGAAERAPATRVPEGPVIIPPIDVPVGLAPPDLAAAATGDDPWPPRAALGTGAPASDGPPARGGAFLPGMVERPALAALGNPTPRYPEQLRSAGIEGRVRVQFIVDTLGRAEMRSLEVLDEDHALFTAAVRRTLPAMRFLPAEAGGRKVRVWVEMSFEFVLDQ